MELIPLELIHSSRDAIRKAREAYLIERGQTLEPKGINKREKFAILSMYFIYSYYLFCLLGLVCLPVGFVSTAIFKRWNGKSGNGESGNGNEEW